MAVVIKDVLPDLINLLRVGILAVQVNVIIELFENETPWFELLLHPGALHQGFKIFQLWSLQTLVVHFLEFINDHVGGALIFRVQDHDPFGSDIEGCTRVNPFLELLQFEVSEEMVHFPSKLDLNPT